MGGCSSKTCTWTYKVHVEPYVARYDQGIDVRSYNGNDPGGQWSTPYSYNIAESNRDFDTARQSSAVSHRSLNCKDDCENRCRLQVRRSLGMGGDVSVIDRFYISCGRKVKIRMDYDSDPDNFWVHDTGGKSTLQPLLEP